MAAPKKNQFWMARSKHGRDALFSTPDLLWDAACEYFTWCEENPFKETLVSAGKKLKVDKMRPFTMEGLCSYLQCNTGYFYDFLQTCSKDFSECVTRIKETVYNQKFSGAASGFLNANLIAYDLNLRKDKDINITNQVDNDKLDKLTQLINDAAKAR